MDGVFRLEGFNIYADSQQEVDELRNTIIQFINYHASKGRKVTAAKVSKAIKSWPNNPIIRNQVISYFK